jgi:DNA-binding response OmpR family regulator
MGMERKLILIADPDREVLRELGNAFHDRGYDVRASRDGSRALEKAILVHPDLVLFDDECPLISPKKFIQILRSNPRTEHIPVLIMRGQDGDDGGLWGYREAVIRKPFNADEVLSTVASIFRRMATARQVREEGREIEGSLGQISLVDLLQIFTLNRKTGLLEIKSAEIEGRIYVHDGGVVHASTGRHRGEKALFRLLQWREGSFAFIPEQVTGDLNIRRSTDMLLLEGARQADELNRLREQLPSDGVRLVATTEVKERFEGLHPVTQEILNLLEFYHTVGDLVDHARVSDYEACRAIRTLIDKGVLQAVEEVERAPDEEPLLGHEVLYELKVKLAARMFSSSRVTRGQICLMASEPGFLKEFVGGLRRLPGFELQGQLEALRNGFGLLGQLHLSENLVLFFMLLSAQPSLWPLIQPLGGARAGLAALYGPTSEQERYRFGLVVQQLTQASAAPLLQLCPPDGVKADGCLTVDPADPGQVRSALVGLLHRMAGQA